MCTIYIRLMPFLIFQISEDAWKMISVNEDNSSMPSFENIKVEEIDIQYENENIKKKPSTRISRIATVSSKRMPRNKNKKAKFNIDLIVDEEKVYNCMDSINEKVENKDSRAIAKNHDIMVDESHKYMHTMQEKVALKDDFIIYGENVASRMRIANEDSRAIAIAKNRIDGILFQLEMGDFSVSTSSAPT